MSENAGEAGPGACGMMLTTLPDRAAAEKLAETLVGERLAACVQMLPIASVYRWQGAVHHESEVLLLVKTRTALFDAATARIRQLHPYDVPEIVGTAFTAGLDAYLGWISAQTAPDSSGPR